MAFVEMDHLRRAPSQSGGALEAEVEALAAENRSIREYLGRVVDLLGARLEDEAPATRRVVPPPSDGFDDDLLPDWARADDARLGLGSDPAVIDARRPLADFGSPAGRVGRVSDDAARIEELERRIRRLEDRLDVLLDRS